jgi:tripartite-type tricarboxylate transporter receptor subunit TctC
MDRRAVIQSIGATAAMAAAPGALSQSRYPSKPITMVVAFGPGTGSDTVARMLAEPMRAALGVPVLIENRLGGSGIIGTEYVARAAPDGYTLTLGSSSSLGTTPVLNPTAKYRVERDFAFVGGVAKTDYLFFTHTLPGAPRTLAELVEQLKGGKGTFGSAGIGTITHLGTEVMLDRVGAKATHVPYKGSGAVVADVAAGHLLFACDSPAATQQLIRGGRLRPLASTGPKRLESLPEVPTMIESGYPDFQVIAWWGIAAPAGTPPEAIRILGDALTKAVSSAEVRQKLKNIDIEPMLMDPPTFAAFVQKETPFWADFIKRTGIKLEM